VRDFDKERSDYMQLKRSYDDLYEDYCNLRASRNSMKGKLDNFEADKRRNNRRQKIRQERLQEERNIKRRVRIEEEERARIQDELAKKKAD
jgi:hypothetical protein